METSQLVLTPRASLSKQDGALESIDFQTLNSVILELYDERQNSRSGWWNGLDGLRHFFSANQVVFISRLRRSGTATDILVCEDQHRPEFERLFMESFAARDPFSNLPPDRACVVQDLMTEERWINTDFYRKFLVPQNVMQVLGADLPVSDGLVLALRICRPFEAKRFSSEDREAFQLLLPHLRRVAENRMRQSGVAASEQVFGSLVDRMGLGCVILDQHGAILRTNDTADEFLIERDGLAVSGEYLRASNTSENKQLQTLIQLALQAHHRGGDAVVGALGIWRRASYDHPLGVVVRSLPRAEFLSGDRQAAVSVAFRDSKFQTSISEAAIKSIFSLTQSETRLALVLAQGMTIDEAADALDVSRNTVRTHLGGLFHKTGTTRQSDLVRVLISSVAAIC